MAEAKPPLKIDPALIDKMRAYGARRAGAIGGERQMAQRAAGYSSGVYCGGFFPSRWRGS